MPVYTSILVNSLGLSGAYDNKGESAVAPPADEVYGTISRNSTALFVSRDVKTIKFNQYLPVVLKSLNVSHSSFEKLVMFWMWRHHGIALWRQGCGVWQWFVPIDS